MTDTAKENRTAGAQGIPIRLREGEEFIRLSQALKKGSLTDSGAEAKALVRSGEIRVNGEPEDRPGRKLYPGDEFVVRMKRYRVVR